jgi:integrase
MKNGNCSMPLKKRRFLRKFMDDGDYQNKLFRSPETLKRMAQKTLNKWDQASQKERMTALKLGMAACINAILYRTSPIRKKNLSHLKFKGEDCDLIVQRNGELRLFIPREQVKNCRDIDLQADDSAAPIVRWYIDNIRFRLLKHHPYGAKLLDSDFLFPSTRLDLPLDDTTLADNYQIGMGSLGLNNLTFHLARHICATLILAQDANAWEQAAAVLCDSVSTVKKHYAWINDDKNIQEGRTYLQQAVKRAKGYVHGRIYE